MSIFGGILIFVTGKKNFFRFLKIFFLIKSVSPFHFQTPSPPFICLLYQLPKISHFSLCGPFAVLMSYLSELHGTKYRSRVMLSTGIFFSLGSVILPSLAWIIIPNKIFNIAIVTDYLGKLISVNFSLFGFS